MAYYKNITEVLSLLPQVEHELKALPDWVVVKSFQVMPHFNGVQERLIDIHTDRESFCRLFSGATVKRYAGGTQADGERGRIRFFAEIRSTASARVDGRYVMPKYKAKEQSDY